MSLKANPPPLAKKHRNSREYNEGIGAYRSGSRDRDCPYPIGSGDTRVAWFCGFLDAQTAHRLSHVWARHGIDWFSYAAGL